MFFDDKFFIAKKIKIARKNAKLTQEELAEKIGITAKQLSRIEMATYIPSLPTFFNLVKELKIDLKSFGLDDIENVNPKQDEFIKLIRSLEDNELEYCYEIIKTVLEKINIIKR